MLVVYHFSWIWFFLPGADVTPTSPPPEKCNFTENPTTTAITTTAITQGSSSVRQSFIKFIFQLYKVDLQLKYQLIYQKIIGWITFFNNLSFLSLTFTIHGIAGGGGGEF